LFTVYAAKRNSEIFITMVKGGDSLGKYFQQFQDYILVSYSRVTVSKKS
jgi:hypothetical protein